MAAKKHTIIHYFATIAFYLLKDIPQILFLAIFVLAGVFVLKSNIALWNLILGVPLVLGFGGVLVNKLFSILYAVLSPTYNRGVCVICNPRNSKDDT